jgi:hypothetical protein
VPRGKPDLFKSSVTREGEGITGKVRRFGEKKHDRTSGVGGFSIFPVDFVLLFGGVQPNRADRASYGDVTG